MVGVHITIDSADIQRVLNDVQQRAADLSPALKAIGEHLDLAARDRWDRQEAPDGSPWARLSDVTIQRKQQRKRQADILVDSTELRDRLRYQLAGQTLEFGSDREYAAVHQFGADRGAFGRNKKGRPIPWGDIPARPFLGITDDDREYIRDVISGYLFDAR